MIELVVFGVGVMVSGMVAFALVQIAQIEKELAAETSAAQHQKAQVPTPQDLPAQVPPAPEPVPRRAA
jgi:hypothetical protein